MAVMLKTAFVVKQFHQDSASTKIRDDESAVVLLIGRRPVNTGMVLLE